VIARTIVTRFHLSIKSLNQIPKFNQRIFYPRINGIPTSVSFTSSVFRRFGFGSESSEKKILILISNQIKQTFYHHHLILIHQPIELMMYH
jgi:hypothetical protein